MAWIESFEGLLFQLVHFCIILLEIFGIVVLLFTAIKSFVLWIKGAGHIALYLARGIALALEFKLGGEVLRTVLVQDWTELGILGAIILLRGLLALLIHWEIGKEEKAAEKKAAAEQPEQSEPKQ